MGAHSRLFPLTIHCEIDLPTNLEDADGYAAITKIVQMCLEIASNISTMKMSRKAMDICEKSRKKYKDEQRKMQEAELAALREEKLREERQKEQQRVSKMSLEDQKKHTERQQKIEQQRKKKGLKRVMK